MPKTKTVEAAKEPEICILKMGKNNNVILWKESMYNMATELFGEVGAYFYTNVAYRYPFPHEREYNPFFFEPALEGPVEGHDAEGEVNEGGALTTIGRSAEEISVSNFAFLRDRIARSWRLRRAS